MVCFLDPCKLRNTVRLFYVANNVSPNYLFWSCLQALNVVDQNFPTISAATSITPATQAHYSGTPIRDDALRNTAAYASPQFEPNTPRTMLSCIDESPCQTIGLPTRENIPKLRVSLITRCSVSAYNTCATQPLPTMRVIPSPMNKPIACHTDPPDNIETRYCSPTSWVSKPVSSMTLSHTVRAQHLSKQHLEANLVASLELPSTNLHSRYRPRS